MSNVNRALDQADLQMRMYERNMAQQTGALNRIENSFGVIAQAMQTISEWIIRQRD